MYHNNEVQMSASIYKLFTLIAKKILVAFLFIINNIKY